MSIIDLRLTIPFPKVMKKHSRPYSSSTRSTPSKDSTTTTKTKGRPHWADDEYNNTSQLSLDLPNPFENYRSRESSLTIQAIHPTSPSPLPFLTYSPTPYSYSRSTTPTQYSHSYTPTPYSQSCSGHSPSHYSPSDSTPPSSYSTPYLSRPPTPYSTSYLNYPDSPTSMSHPSPRVSSSSYLPELYPSRTPSREAYSDAAHSVFGPQRLSVDKRASADRPHVLKKKKRPTTSSSSASLPARLTTKPLPVAPVKDMAITYPLWDLPLDLAKSDKDQDPDTATLSPPKSESSNHHTITNSSRTDHHRVTGDTLFAEYDADPEYDTNPRFAGSGSSTVKHSNEGVSIHADDSFDNGHGSSWLCFVWTGMSIKIPSIFAVKGKYPPSATAE